MFRALETFILRPRANKLKIKRKAMKKSKKMLRSSKH